VLNTYMAGQVVQSNGMFITTSTGALVDPTVVDFKYSIAGGTTTTLTYSGASVPAVGVVARLSQGVYAAQVDTTGSPGTWEYEWYTTGTGQTVGASSFTVVAIAL
jgi:hypothetical protein